MRGVKACKGCGQPMLRRGQKRKHPDDHRHAKGCPLDWRNCKHESGSLRDSNGPNFGVAFGSKQACKKCGAVEFENWCETRASGGIPKIHPPEEPKND